MPGIEHRTGLVIDAYFSASKIRWILENVPDAMSRARDGEILFGTIEHPEHVANHLLRTRALQRETGGFTEFVPLPFVHMASPIHLQGRARLGPTFREVLLMHSVGRIAYRGAIDNVQVSWVKCGTAGAQQVLRAGANDLGGTLMDESISRAAGTEHGQEFSPEGMEALIASLGRVPRQRTTLYGAAKHPHAVAETATA